MIEYVCMRFQMVYVLVSPSDAKVSSFVFCSQHSCKPLLHFCDFFPEHTTNPSAKPTALAPLSAHQIDSLTSAMSKLSCDPHLSSTSISTPEKKQVKKRGDQALYVPRHRREGPASPSASSPVDEQQNNQQQNDVSPQTPTTPTQSIAARVEEMASPATPSSSSSATTRTPKTPLTPSTPVSQPTQTLESSMPPSIDKTVRISGTQDVEEIKLRWHDKVLFENVDVKMPRNYLVKRITLSHLEKSLEVLTGPRIRAGTVATNDHILELCDFASSTTTEEITELFAPHQLREIAFRWADDTHLVAVCSSVRCATNALTYITDPNFTLKRYTEASPLYKQQPVPIPGITRPPTSAVVADRFIRSALGLKRS
eukprot:c4284_g1_i2.p1 GENE.c4284_g1_i2~~c4284_g1_i2.p1  ORF type:complete len:369 (+),score=74.23 c4284_g1_i2:238-1344(+)